MLKLFNSPIKIFLACACLLLAGFVVFLCWRNQNCPEFSEDFEGVQADNFYGFLKDPAIFNLRDPKTFYFSIQLPVRERVERELKAAFSDFEPERVPAHRNFSTVIALGDYTKRPVDGLPESMKNLQAAYNAMGDDYGRAIWRELKRHGDFPWTRLMLLEHWEIRTNYWNDLAGTFLKSTQGDALAPRYAFWVFRGEFAKVLEKVNDDPWLAEMLTGTRIYQEAWDARGGGYAYEVTEEGWRVFYEKLPIAAEHFRRAGTLRPDCEVAFGYLAKIALDGCGSDEEALDATKKLILARADSPIIPGDLGFKLLPRWGGSTRLSVDVAKNLAAHFPAGSDPALPIHLFRHIRKDYDLSEYLTFCTPELWQSLRRVYDRECALGREREDRLPHWIFVRFALACGAFDDAAEIFEKYKEDVVLACNRLRMSSGADSFAFVFVDAPSFVPAFSTGNRSRELQKIWIEARGKCVPENLKSELEKITRDETADLNSRQVSLALYELFFMRSGEQASRRYYATFPEKCVSRFIEKNCRRISKNEISPEALVKFLECAAHVPGALDETANSGDFGAWTVSKLVGVNPRWGVDDIPAGTRQALIDFALKNSPELASKMLENCLKVQAFWSRLDEIGRLLEGGTPAKNIKVEGSTLGSLVLYPQRRHLLKKLLKAGLSPDQIADNKFTLLAFAVKNEYFDAAEMLLNAGASPDWKPDESEAQSLTDFLAVPANRNPQIVKFCKKHKILSEKVK